MCRIGPAPLSRRRFLRDSAGVLGALGLPAFLAPDARAGVAERPDLEVALRAERWIRASRVATPHGIAWPVDPLDPASVRTDLYSGSAGVVLFLLELHRATGEGRFLEEAAAGADHLLGTAAGEAEMGLYTGLAGTAFVLGEAAAATGEPRFAEGAATAVRRLAAGAVPAGAGAAWNESADVVSGSAGMGLLLLRRHETHGERPALDAAAAAGRRLVELGIPAPGGLKWALAPGVESLYPNFSHGTAGVAYFLASLHAATGDERFLEAALAGAGYLRAVADPASPGVRVFHHEPGGEDLYYLSWCHGPGGTARLFHRLAEATGDPRWNAGVDACAEAVLATGIPERRTPGFWSNVSQCCGNAGVGEFFLSLHRLRPAAERLGMARRCADDTLRRAGEAAEGLRWVQAEHRVRPDLLVAQTGFMQGAAGIGTFFLRLDAQAGGRRPAVRFPDSPFP